MSGAAPAMAMNSQVTTSEPAPQIPPQSPSVSQPLPSEISSTTFPLGSSWLFAQIIQTFVGVGFVGVIIFFWFTGSFGKSFPQGGVSSFGFDIIIGIIILLIIAIIMVFVQKSNYYFIFTSDFILYRTGLIALQERHVPYSKIQDVTISRGFIDMIFGLWNVTVENAAQVTFGRNAQNSRVIIMGLTKSQADFIANQTRSIMNAQNGQTTHL